MTEYGKKLIDDLGYNFNAKALLQLALTHSSANGFQNNQRLEFLGDAILNFVIADHLYTYNLTATEGELTRIRSFLVQETTLYKIASALKMQEMIILGSGELKTGGMYKSSILADTLESVIAAIYLDSNLNQVNKLIISWYQKLNYFNLDGTINKSHKDLLPENKDPKSRLQELLHAKGLKLPVYEIIEISGEPHKQKFKVACTVDGLMGKIYGLGPSRKKAEQQAATKLLRLLS